MTHFSTYRRFHLGKSSYFAFHFFHPDNMLNWSFCIEDSQKCYFHLIRMWVKWILKSDWVLNSRKHRQNSNWIENTQMEFIKLKKTKWKIIESLLTSFSRMRMDQKNVYFVSFCSHPFIGSFNYVGNYVQDIIKNSFEFLFKMIE